MIRDVEINGKTIHIVFCRIMSVIAARPLTILLYVLGLFFVGEANSRFHKLFSYGHSVSIVTDFCTIDTTARHKELINNVLLPFYVSIMIFFVTTDTP